jgi:hypothetical protein
MKILATFETPKAPATCAGRVILVHREGSYDPYVTWWENTEYGGRCWGHYFSDLGSAKKDFCDRVMRGY